MGLEVIASLATSSDQLDVNTPKVVDECDQIGHQFAASQIAKREAAPAPVVFQFVVAVFVISERPRSWLASRSRLVT